MTRRRIYLDNAATSWPKPDSVYQSVDQFQRNVGSGMGRSSGAQADSIRKQIQQLRQELIEFVHGPPACKAIFAFNGTDALNLGIQGLLRKGDHVVTTTAEHNSVLRPLRHLENQRQIEVTRIPCDSYGTVSPSDVIAAVRPNTRLVGLIQTSNVTGGSNSVQEIGQHLEGTDSLLLVDAAQTIGCHRIDMKSDRIDLLAFPGHKGLWGPLGTGCLVVSQKAQQTLQPIRFGGTGASSDSDLHPVHFPDGFEAGNLNVPGLLGLRSGLQFVKSTGLDQIAARKCELVSPLYTLDKIPNLDIVSSKNDASSGIFSFKIRDVDPHEVALILDQNYSIEVRAGHHCASLIHPYLSAPHGTVRISVGYFNREDEIKLVIKAIGEISAAYQ